MFASLEVDCKVGAKTDCITSKKHPAVWVVSHPCPNATLSILKSDG